MAEKDMNQEKGVHTEAEEDVEGHVHHAVNQAVNQGVHHREDEGKRSQVTQRVLSDIGSPAWTSWSIVSQAWRREATLL